jgi:hypothetical protein
MYVWKFRSMVVVYFRDIGFCHGVVEVFDILVYCETCGSDLPNNV